MQEMQVYKNCLEEKEKMILFARNHLLENTEIYNLELLDKIKRKKSNIFV